MQQTLKRYTKNTLSAVTQFKTVNWQNILLLVKRVCCVFISVILHFCDLDRQFQVLHVESAHTC